MLSHLTSISLFQFASMPMVTRDRGKNYSISTENQEIRQDCKNKCVNKSCNFKFLGELLL